MKNCIDCGRPLSPTAKSCGGCDSTDPFGKERLNKSIYNTIRLILIAFFSVIGLLWYLGWFDPIEFVSNWILSTWK